MQETLSTFILSYLSTLFSARTHTHMRTCTCTHIDIYIHRHTYVLKPYRGWRRPCKQHISHLWASQVLCKYPGERGDEPWRPVSPNLGRHLISTISHGAFSITPRWIEIVPEGSQWQHDCTDYQKILQARRWGPSFNKKKKNFLYTQLHGDKRFHRILKLQHIYNPNCGLFVNLTEIWGINFQIVIVSQHYPQDDKRPISLMPFAIMFSSGSAHTIVSHWQSTCSVVLI